MKNSYFNYQMSSTRCKYSFIFPRLRAVSRGTQMATRVTAGARRERHEKRESQFFLLGLPPSFRASRGFAAELSAICDPRSSAIIWKPAFTLIFNHYPAKSEEYRRYSARLSRIMVLLFNTLMTKAQFSTFIGKNAGKTTIFLRDTKN